MKQFQQKIVTNQLSNISPLEEKERKKSFQLFIGILTCGRMLAGTHILFDIEIFSSSSSFNCIITTQILISKNRGRYT